MPTTAGTVIARAREALDGLELLGEDVEDEWTYVTELAGAWRDRLDAVAAKRNDEALPDDRAAAVDRAIDEASLISDPHRAIDWLSTFPQIVLLALGEPP